MFKSNNKLIINKPNNMNFKVEEENGKFVVMVETPIVKPFWKFWGPTMEWKVATKKDGTPCKYDKKHHADSCLRLYTMN